jgi:hypothetical protein
VGRMHSRPVSPPVVLLMATLAPAVFSRERAGVQDGVFDVTAFGGVGDGEHNNTAAFRAGAFHFFGRSQHHQHAHRRGTRANTRTNCVPAWERLPCWENLVMASTCKLGNFTRLPLFLTVHHCTIITVMITLHCRMAQRASLQFYLTAQHSAFIYRPLAIMPILALKLISSQLLSQ